MALNDTVNNLCNNPPMSPAGPKRPERKARPFAQAEPSASASLKVRKQTEDGLAVWRGRSVGVVFQFFQLLPTLTVLENVMLPMDLSNSFRNNEREKRAMQLLEAVDIADQAHKLPANISGGQQQRVAIARALANDPPLVVADEPTGNLVHLGANSE